MTNPEGLWTNMKRAATNKKVYLGGENLDKIMAGWTDNPGHPVVSVVKTASGVYNITQVGFSLLFFLENLKLFFNCKTYGM